MKKLSKLDKCFQEIEIKNLDVINDFINTFTPFWKEDIINFKDEINVLEIDELLIDSYTSIYEDIDYILFFKNGNYISYYIPEDKLIAWLEKHDLVE